MAAKEPKPKKGKKVTKSLEGVNVSKGLKKAPAAKGVGDCRFKKEEDERLNCYNGFAESIPKF